MFAERGSTLNLPVLLLLLLMLAALQVGAAAERGRLRHRRGHRDGHLQCPDGCVCRPVGEVPCDWCLDTAAAGHQDDRVSCQGCDFDGGEQVRRFIHSFIHSFGVNNKVQDIKVTKTLTYVLGLNTKHQHDMVR